MNIGILTLRLVNNYGGVLQAYALSTYLKKLGHNAMFFDRIGDRPYWKRILGIALTPFFNHIRKETRCTYRNITGFIDRNIERTYFIDSDRVIKKELHNRHIDAMIVGSDQVWRRSFVLPFGYNYFLDFVPRNIRKISYAASFGLSEWEYTPEETSKISDCLKRFDAISVREDDAVLLCKKYLNVNALHVLDPTLLLTQADYNKIVSDRKVQGNYVFVYWLGDSSVLDSILKGLKIDRETTIVDVKLRDEDEQISIEDWLSYIKYAQYVVTDSFHGCVFSIIFEKQFRIFMNESGGTGRLKSLIRMLELEDIIGDENKIDYKLLNNRLKELRTQSENFIINALSK